MFTWYIRKKTSTIYKHVLVVCMFFYCYTMASTKSQSVEQGDKTCLRVLVDKERNRVLYAESGKDFVDVLFGFFTLPLGTIARLVAENSNIEAVKFGSISSLYESISNLTRMNGMKKSSYDLNWSIPSLTFQNHH